MCLVLQSQELCSGEHGWSGWCKGFTGANGATMVRLRAGLCWDVLYLVGQGPGSRPSWAIRSIKPQVLTCISLDAAHGMLGQHIVLLREGGISCHQDTPCQPAKLRA